MEMGEEFFHVFSFQNWLFFSFFLFLFFG